MSLTIYRRHTETCKHAGDRISKQCDCQLWMTGTLFGRQYRKTAKTRSWKAAEKIKRSLEDGEQKPAISLKDACDLFVDNCESRGYRTSSLGKMKRLCLTLQDFAGNKNLDEIDAVLLNKFRKGWKDAAITQQKKLERLRSIFKWFEDSDMVQKSPARGMKATLTHDTAVEPFSAAEQAKILESAYRLAGTRVRAKQVILHPLTGTFAKLLLHSALRIGDAAMITKDRLQNGRLFLYATKNKKPVTLPLPPDLLAELQAIKTDPLFPSPEGSTRPETVSDYWRDQLIKVFDAAEIEGAHPHRFRHSLAKNMLDAGSSVEDVALVLGNSPAIVMKHYSAFVQSRQERIDREVQKAWQKPKLLRVK